MNYKTRSAQLFLAAAAWLMVSAQASSPQIVQARVVLGVEGIANDSTGALSIQGDALVFARHEGSVVRVPLSAIQGAFLSQQDKQLGGTPMALGRAATPFGGGRVIGMFSHKKYDFVTLEYLDSNEGFHATIYQLNHGQGQILRKELESKGVHVTGLDIAKTERENNAK